MSMQLSLIKDSFLFTRILPEKRSGQYWVTQIDEYGNEERVISVEGIEEQWILKSNKNVIIQDQNGQRIKELVVEPLSFYSIYLRKSNEKVWLYSEPVTNDRKSFIKLQLPPHGNITIGRSEQTDICYSNMYASSNHAELVISSTEVTLHDLDSSNGTFNNGLRVKNKLVLPGDIINILGLK